MLSPPYQFESSVILDGTQTYIVTDVARAVFESSVILDGTQTPNTSTAQS